MIDTGALGFLTETKNAGRRRTSQRPDGPGCRYVTPDSTVVLRLPEPIWGSNDWASAGDATRVAIAMAAKSRLMTMSFYKLCCLDLRSCRYAQRRALQRKCV